MIARRWIAVVLLALGWQLTAAAESGQAVISGTSDGSSITGSASLKDTPDGLVVSVEINGAPPGQHGLHIHQFGACNDQGKAAGGHYNPDAAPHGLLMKDGAGHAHAGDLGNIEIGADGRGRLESTAPGVTLASGPRSVGGRAIILHEKADDFGQPTGNAGVRIGCGVIEVRSP